jgi:hypothetical protein
MPETVVNQAAVVAESSFKRFLKTHSGKNCFLFVNHSITPLGDGGKKVKP